MKIKDILWILWNMKGGTMFLWQMAIDSLSSKLHWVTYKPGPTPKRIVVVGGSYAGYNTTKNLANRIPSGWTVTMVEKAQYLNHSFVVPRYSVFEGHEHNAFIPLADQKQAGELVPPGSFTRVTGEVVQVKSDDGKRYVKLQDGTVIEYEFLVIATGTTMSLPISRDCDLDAGVVALRGEQTKIRDAQSIAVIGAGAVGIELATDIKYKYGDAKRVVLYSSRGGVLPRFQPSVSDMAVAEIEKLGVEIVFNARPQVSNISKSVVVDGVEQDFDLVYSCVGGHANTEPFHDLLSESTFEKSGVIRTLDTLQVDSDGLDNVFAVGDVQTRGAKMARAAWPQARVVSDNIVKLIKGQAAHKLSKYHSRPIENALKLTLGLQQSLLSVQDEVRMQGYDGKEDYLMDSDRTWGFFDVPYTYERKGGL